MNLNLTPSCLHKGLFEKDQYELQIMVEIRPLQDTGHDPELKLIYCKYGNKPILEYLYNLR